MRIQRQRQLARVAGRQRRGQDHDAFRVDRSAQLDLPLDVDDPSGADTRRRRDTYRVAEAMLTEIDDRQAVDLPNCFTSSVDEEQVARDPVLDAGGHAPEAPCHFVDSLAHVVGADGGGLRFSRPVIGLRQEVVDGADPHRQPFTVVGQARALFHDSLHGRPVEGQQLALADPVRDLRDVVGLVVRATLQVVVEVGGNLEKIPELAVVQDEQVVQPALADQQHLDVERDGFRPQRRRAEQAVRLARGLDAQAGGKQRLLQRLPDERPGEHPVDVEHQVAAVRSVQGAGPNHPEIGEQGTHFGAMLDLADDVAVVRVRLKDDRCRCLRLVRHQQVDFVAPEASPSVLLHEGHRRGLGCLEVLGIGDDVGVYLLEVAHDLGQVTESLDQFGERDGDGVLGDLAIERLDALAVLLAYLRHVLDVFAQLPAEAFDCRFRRLADLIRLLGEFLLVHDLAVVHRREHVAGRRLQHGDVFFTRPLLELLAARLDLFLCLVLDGLELGAVIVTFERRGNRELQLLDQPRHAVRERFTAARRKPEVARLLRVIEVVDVAPVVAGRPARRVFADQRVHQAVPVAAGRPEDEHVVSGVCNFQAEPNGVDRASLAHATFGRWNVGAGFERQVLEIARPPQFRRRYLEFAATVRVHRLKRRLMSGRIQYHESISGDTNNYVIAALAGAAAKCPGGPPECVAAQCNPAKITVVIARSLY